MRAHKEHSSELNERGMQDYLRQFLALPGSFSYCDCGQRITVHIGEFKRHEIAGHFYCYGCLEQIARCH